MEAGRSFLSPASSFPLGTHLRNCLSSTSSSSSSSSSTSGQLLFLLELGLFQMFLCTLLCLMMNIISNVNLIAQDPLLLLWCLHSG
jgi:hypothetical protein